MQNFWTFDEISSNSCALVIPGTTALTYGELSQQANTWSQRIEQITSGRRCLVALEFDVDAKSIAAYIGALRAGYPILIMEPGQLVSGDRIETIWRPEVHIPAGASDPVLRHTPDENTAEPHRDLKILLSTSGSTGDPKLVRLSDRNIASNAQAIAEYLDVTAEDCAAVTLPFHYSYGLSVLNSYLAAGASLMLTRQSVTEPAFWEAARTSGVTSLALVPHQFDLLSHTGFFRNRIALVTIHHSSGRQA